MKDCCSPPTTSLSERKTDVPFASELCFFSPKSPQISGPRTRQRHTNSSPEPATHNGYRRHFQKNPSQEGCCFQQIQRCCLQSFLLTDQAAAGTGIYLMYLLKAWNNVCSFTEGCYLHTAGFYRLQETITERQQVKQ